MAALAMKKIEMMIVIVIGILFLGAPAVVSEYVDSGAVAGPLPGNAEEANECWSALIGIPGCLNGSRISAAGIFSPACCNEAKKISEDCWLNLFPLFPFLAQLLKNFCSQLPSPPPA